MTEAQHTAHAAQMESAAMAAREEALIAALREAPLITRIERVIIGPDEAEK